jgi:hypothetical protein
MAQTLPLQGGQVPDPDTVTDPTKLAPVKTAQALAPSSAVAPAASQPSALQAVSAQPPTAQMPVPAPGTTPAGSTVEGRVADIIRQGGPLQQLGQTRAAQIASNRGLLNTSMAAGAAQKANIESALPIAQQDAGFFQQASLQAQRGDIDASLQAQRGELEKSLQNRKAEIDKELTTATADEQVRLVLEKAKVDTDLRKLTGQLEEDRLRVAGELDAQLAEQRGEIQSNLQELVGSQALQQQGLKGEQSKELVKIEKDYAVLMNTQQTAANIFAQTSNDISAILANPDIPKEAKPGLIKQQMTLLNSSLGVVGGISDMDLTGLLNFNTGLGGGGSPYIPARPAPTPARPAGPTRPARPTGLASMGLAGFR